MALKTAVIFATNHVVLTACSQSTNRRLVQWQVTEWFRAELTWGQGQSLEREEQAMNPIPERARFLLMGMIYRPANVEMPWVVQDFRKSLKHECPCATKAEVLDKVAEIMDDMAAITSPQ